SLFPAKPRPPARVSGQDQGRHRPSLAFSSSREPRWLPHCWHSNDLRKYATCRATFTGMFILRATMAPWEISLGWGNDRTPLYGPENRLQGKKINLNFT